MPVTGRFAPETAIRQLIDFWLFAIRVPSLTAGPVRNKEELKGFFEIIVERLQRLYDVQP